jgi:hypothetical protein
MHSFIHQMHSLVPTTCLAFSQVLSIYQRKQLTMILPLSLYVKGEMEVLDIKTKHIAQYVRMWYVL